MLALTHRDLYYTYLLLYRKQWRIISRSSEKIRTFLYYIYLVCHKYYTWTVKRNKILRVQYKKIRKKIHTECNSERCNPDINYSKRLPNYGFSICRSFSFLTTIQGKITLILSAYFQFQFISCFWPDMERKRVGGND